MWFAEEARVCAMHVGEHVVDVGPYAVFPTREPFVGRGVEVVAAPSGLDSCGIVERLIDDTGEPAVARFLACVREENFRP